MSEQEKNNIDKRFDALETLILKEDNSDIKKLNERFDELDIKIEPIIVWFGHMNWVKTGILYTAGFIVTIGSAFFMIKSLWSK